MDESIKDEIRALLNDLESDRIERTISTTNTDKFGQAICAFANDLPNHQMPGFLFLGVLDNGEIQGVDVTDELLKNVAAIRTAMPAANEILSARKGSFGSRSERSLSNSASLSS